MNPNITEGFSFFVDFICMRKYIYHLKFEPSIACKRAQSPPKMIFFSIFAEILQTNWNFHSKKKNCTIYMSVVLTRTTLKTETSLELHLRLVDTQLVLIYNHRTEKSFWTNILYSMITNFRVEFIVTHFKQTFYCKMSKLFLLKSSLNLSDYFT